ncbi:unnamed protein product [Litomosoides sigmodontis]|uniref:Uncharacterized protein n=1 Tax=Litomosoides sigmodontis TaxID=42156 RepID=A0A3P6T1V3_LITSI|nr:unnamed protein product [Litomosoides sigmodontis]
MPLMADDLHMKYGVVNQNDVAGKKKRKKSKGRTLEIDFPLHPNGLIRSHEASICCTANNQKVLPTHAADTDAQAQGDNCSDDIISQLLPIVRDVMQTFLYDVGNRACEVEEVINFLKLSDITLHHKQMLDSLSNAQLCRLFGKLNIFHTKYDGSRVIFQTADEQFQFPNSDTNLSPSISSLSNADNTPQLFTLMKSTSGTSVAQTKPLSSITNDFTKLPQRHLNGTGKVDCGLDNVINSHQKIGDMMTHKHSSMVELFVQQNEDIFYDQNTELTDRKMLMRNSRYYLERRLIEQRLKDVEKRYEQRLSNVSLMLRKAYKEILDLRLGKAKALANKRMGQAELALKHANVIHNRIKDETVKSDIKQVVKQWEQILWDYKTWHANLDEIVDGQKTQVDSNYRFDELALLSPPDNIPCAPQLPPNALKYFQQLEFKCSDPSSELLRVIGPPVGFEMEAVAGNRFGAIGQPAPPPQRKIFTEVQINKLIEKTLEHFQDIGGNIPNLSAEEIRNVLNELERRPSLLPSDVTFSSVLSHVIKRVVKVNGAGGGRNNSQSDTTCWTSLSSEQSITFPPPFTKIEMGE